MSREPGTYIELDTAWNDPGWTRVPNTIARCNTVSRRVKGWVLEVASHATGRRITFAEMLKCSTDGRDATYATIKEAVDAGFVTRRQERDSNGRVGAVVYRLHVTPQNPRSEPLPDFPDTAEPDTAKPETIKQKTKNLKDQEPKHGDESPPEDRGAEDQNISVPLPGDAAAHQHLSDVWDQPPGPETYARTPENHGLDGDTLRLCRRFDFYGKYLPGGADPDELVTVEAMSGRGYDWRAIFRRICKQRGYDRAYIDELFARVREMAAV